MADDINKHTIWEIVRKSILNKYVLTLAVAAFIFVFVGEQSLVRDIRRGRKIKQAEEMLEKVQGDIELSQRKMENLKNTDSLERFAREQYYMRADNEEVFVIDD